MSPEPRSEPYEGLARTLSKIAGSYISPVRLEIELKPRLEQAARKIADMSVPTSEPGTTIGEWRDILKRLLQEEIGGKRT